MSTESRCPKCGGELAPGQPCRKCLLRLALVNTNGSESLTESAAHDVLLTANDRIGNYQIIRVLGEGGMGVVYEAKQEHPRRTIAVRWLRPDVPAKSCCGDSSRSPRRWLDCNIPASRKSMRRVRRIRALARSPTLPWNSFMVRR